MRSSSLSLRRTDPTSRAVAADKVNNHVVRAWRWPRGRHPTRAGPNQPYLRRDPRNTRGSGDAIRLSADRPSFAGQKISAEREVELTDGKAQAGGEERTNGHWPFPAGTWRNKACGMRNAESGMRNARIRRLRDRNLHQEAPSRTSAPYVGRRSGELNVQSKQYGGEAVFTGHMDDI